MPVVRIAEVAFTSDGHDGDVVHDFDTDGFDSLCPKCSEPGRGRSHCLRRQAAAARLPSHRRRRARHHGRRRNYQAREGTAETGRTVEELVQAANRYDCAGSDTYEEWCG
jgi:hypothetical protein